MADGKGCKCWAKGEHECACEGVDWTPQEMIDLRAENSRLKAEVAAMLLANNGLKEVVDKTESLEIRLAEACAHLNKCLNATEIRNAEKAYWMEAKQFLQSPTNSVAKKCEHDGGDYWNFPGVSVFYKCNYPTCPFCDKKTGGV